MQYVKCPNCGYKGLTLMENVCSECHIVIPGITVKKKLLSKSYLERLIKDLHGIITNNVVCWPSQKCGNSSCDKCLNRVTDSIQLRDLIGAVSKLEFVEFVESLEPEPEPTQWYYTCYNSNNKINTTALKFKDENEAYRWLSEFNNGVKVLGHVGNYYWWFRLYPDSDNKYKTSITFDSPEEALNHIKNVYSSYDPVLIEPVIELEPPKQTPDQPDSFRWQYTYIQKDGNRSPVFTTEIKYKTYGEVYARLNGLFDRVSVLCRVLEPKPTHWMYSFKNDCNRLYITQKKYATREEVLASGEIRTYSERFLLSFLEPVKE